MHLSRRSLLAAGLALPTWAAKKPGSVKLGVTDWNLRLRGKVEALALGARIGFQGVEVSLVPTGDGARLELEDNALLERYAAESKRLGIAIAGTALTECNRVCMVSEKRAQQWLAAAIPITAQLKARVILIPFFAKCELKQPSQIDALVGILKEQAPAAEHAQVKLGLENYLSAEDTVKIMDRVGSKAVMVYYDLKNSFDAGHDPYRELRWLTAKRICQIHLKDKAYLGEGVIDYAKGMKIVGEIGYRGFANLETAAPSGSVENDMRRNLAYIRGLMS
jgi:L-ribulose-5-phosphate 3-epimerase